MRALWPAAALTGLLGIFHGAGARDFFRPGGDVERAAYDTHVVLRSWLSPAPAPDERLLLLTYDDATRVFEDAYPSNRHVLADAVERLADAKARSVFLDFRLDVSVLAGVADRLDVLRGKLPPDADSQATELAKITDDLRGDERLAAAMARIPTTLIYACRSVVEAREVEPAFLRKAQALPVTGTPQRVRRVGGLTPPVPKLAENAAALAHSCEFPDSDGVLRSDPSVIALPAAGRVYYLPSAATMIAGEALGLPVEAASVEPAGVRLGNRLVPFSADGQTLLDLAGPGGSFRGRMGTPARFSMAALLRGEVPASRLENRIVLVGETLATSRDLKVTSFGEGISRKVPGVEKIAMQANYLTTATRFLVRPTWASNWGFLLTVLVGLIAAMVGSRVGFYPALALCLLSPVVFLVGTASLTWGSVWIDTAFPAVAWTTGLVTAAFVRYAQDLRERRSLENAFERYVPRDVVKAILRDPSAAKLMGETRQMTVLFADLRGFTTFSEGHSPAEVVAHLNDHLTLMSEVIQKYGGTVDKFIGDAVMAFWGAPLPDEAHAAHACQAAREMLTLLDRKNEERIVRGLPMLDMGIGLNTGAMIVGNMGSTKRFNYTVIGDAVNLASRLEGLTKEYHERILVGPETRKAASKYYGFRSLGEVTVKGKQERVPVFSLEESGQEEAAKPAPVSRTRPR